MLNTNTISDKEIISLAEKSNSLSDLCKKIGTRNRNKITEVLLKLNFNFEIFKGQNVSVFNNKEKLEKIVKESYNLSEVCFKFGLSENNSTLKKYLKKYSISTDHFIINMNYKNKGSNGADFNEKYFSINSEKSNGSIIKIIKKFNLIPYKCAVKKCSNTGTWMRKSITLQLEHKNGIRNDNRIENLEFLCPNCHTQTPTYGSKNKKFLSKQENNIIYKYTNNINKFFNAKENTDELLKKVKNFNSYSQLLVHLNFAVNAKNNGYIKNILEKYKEHDSVIIFNENRILKNRNGIEFPPIDVLKEMIENSNYSAVGRKLNCSDNAIRKHLRKFILVD